MSVKKANILYHTKRAESYDQTQPQFKPENIEQVERRLKAFALKHGEKRLLDIGCGTGFVSLLAYPYFKEVYGIDITPAMLNKTNSKIKKQKINNVVLSRNSSEKLPFPDLFFDVVSAYGVLHHLPSLPQTFREVYRVLREGGLFYSDLDPNYYFWKTMKSLPDEGISEILEKEKKSVINMVENVPEKIDKEIIETAEYFKTRGGFKENIVKKMLYKVGFKNVRYDYTWYWQEGKVIKDLSVETANYFENHLRSALPLTRHFFKYIRIEAIK